MHAVGESCGRWWANRGDEVHGSVSVGWNAPSHGRRKDERSRRQSAAVGPADLDQFGARADGGRTINTRWWPPTLLDSGLCVLRDVETTGRRSNASARCDEVEDAVGDAVNYSEINYLHGAVRKPSLLASFHVDSLMPLTASLTVS